MAATRMAFFYLALCSVADALRLHAPAHGRHGSLRRSSSITSPGFFMSESNEEIAALEARLSELKRAKEQKRQESEAAERQIGNSASGSKSVVSTTAADVDTAFDFATLSSRKKVAVVKSETPDEFLSEAWKEQDAEQAGINIGSILAGIALVIGFIAFAQVPIGQNIDQATYGGVTPPPPSPDEIRKLYEGGA
jgi:hypothetical protein